MVEQGGKLVADGTATLPITFTALNAEVTSSSSVGTDSSSSSGTVVLETRGKWGGIIILGNAPTSAASYTANFIEGISGKPYGGTDPADSSGTLRYVRVWHGGAVIGADNEINGITFGGVGSGTVVDHCEVAFNADDGFEFFGGTVNVKYLSVLFGGDDSFDTDEGYQGKGQFLFTMLGSSGNHGTEMNAHTSVGVDAQPRSHPAFYGMTVIGGSTGGRSGALMRVRGGSGGKFGNIVLAFPKDEGFRNDACGSETKTQTLPAASTSIGAIADGSTSGYLYFSSNNIINGASTPVRDDCSSNTFTTYVSSAPGFASVSSSCVDYGCLTSTFNPLPSSNSVTMCGSVDGAPNGDAFYDSATCKGAFASSATADNWLRGWSWLDCSSKMAHGLCTGGIPTSPFATLADTVGALGGDTTSSVTLSATTSYLLTSQYFVKSGHTLTIPAGTSIYALPAS